MLITVEGLDGTGKSTLAAGVSKEFNAVMTREPGSPLSERCKNIREIVLNDSQIDPVSRELLFLADANIHRQKIEELGNQLVISDRGLWSHRAYLYGLLATKQMMHDKYSLLKKTVAITSHAPDAFIYIQGDVALMKERLSKGKKDVIENLPDSFFSYVLVEYDDLLADYKRQGFPVLTLNGRDSAEDNLSKAIDFVKGLL